MRELVLGAMPLQGSPDTHIPAGVWCFSGREDFFPGWDTAPAPTNVRLKHGFTLPPDPFTSGDEMAAFARAANGEVLRLLDVFGKQLNQEWRTGYSPAFWEMALGPWLIVCVHALAERQKRLLDLIALYGKEPLRVSLLPDTRKKTFQTTFELLQDGILNVEFNHYIFSRILESLAPATWTCVYEPPQHQGEANQPEGQAGLDAVPDGAPFSAPASAKGCGYMSEEDRRTLRKLHAQRLSQGQRAPLKARLRAYIAAGLRDLPFPRYKGFSLLESLLLSVEVLKTDQSAKNSKPDQTLPLSLYADAPLHWQFPAEQLIASCLPKDICQQYAPAIRNVSGKIRGMTAAVSQDDRYRLRLAAWREGGGKLFCIQHGANYGNLLSMGGSFFEYRQHAFFTWGWEHQSGFPCNAVPLIHPLLARIRDTHVEKNKTLLLVGTEMVPFVYRLKSRPQAGALPGYRRAKLAFLKGLPDAILQDSLYRPYFPSPAALEDGVYIQRHKPGLRLCTGDLTQHMLNCRLLVLDHYGTSLHMALAANIPTICFWDTKQWAMTTETERLLMTLGAAGIFWKTPEEAAQKVAAVWDAPSVWWSSEQIQSARTLWMHSYARCFPEKVSRISLNIFRTWKEAISKL